MEDEKPPCVSLAKIQCRATSLENELTRRQAEAETAAAECKRLREVAPSPRSPVPISSQLSPGTRCARAIGKSVEAEVAGVRINDVPLLETTPGTGERTNKHRKAFLVND